jgi:hypothetical protein
MAEKSTLQQDLRIGDYPAEEERVVSIPVEGPDDTNLVIHTILARLGDK